MTMPPKEMPIQVGGFLKLSERRGERPVIVRALPWEMVADEATAARCLKNHDQTLERIAERGGFGASEAIRCIAGLGLFDDVTIPEAQAHRILYAMRVLFNRGQRVAEAKATGSACV